MSNVVPINQSDFIPLRGRPRRGYPGYRARRNPHELRSMLVLAIELAKYYFTLDEIAEVLSDELGALLARPDTVRYLRKQKA